MQMGYGYMVLNGKKFGIAAFTAAMLASSLQATTQTGTMAVNASVAANCTITPAALNFGAVTGAQADASSTLAVACTNTTPYTVALDIGAGSGATVAVRKMTSSTNTLAYSVYQDSGRATLWGTTGAQLVSGTGNGSTQNLTVYGRVSGGQTPVPGTYVDSVTATITY